MCRFALYLGPEITLSSLITEPSHSIIHQSFQSREREEPLNGDGFGVAWYAPDFGDEPALFRDVSPAWNNQNLISIARVTRSRCILAHVRAATAGLPVTQLNCHPFSWGPFSFMHNGIVGGFRQTRRRLHEALSDEAYEAVHGNTDSEHLFGLFIDQYRKGAEEHPVERMVDALMGAIEDMEKLRGAAGITEPSLLNIAISDGRRGIATRYISDGTEAANTLYVQSGSRYECRNGVCHMLPAEETVHAVVVASEPLDPQSEWLRIEPNELVIVRSDCAIERRPIPAFG